MIYSDLRGRGIMAEGGVDKGVGVFGQFAARLSERRARAERAGDAPAIARYDAMQAVLKTKLVPLVCPEALTMAGEAARAACDGLEEGQWLRIKCKECDRLGESRIALYKAIRLLKTVGIWPWEPAGGKGLPAKDQGEAPLAVSADKMVSLPDGGSRESSVSLET
jgi:hypothetical protein